MTDRGKPKGRKKKQNVPSIMQMAEFHAGAPLNELLSQEEKEKILLPSILNEGSAAIDTKLQIGMSIIAGQDGTLLCLDWQFNLAVSRDGGRSWTEHRVMEPPAELIASDEQNKSQPDPPPESFGWLRLPSGKIGMGFKQMGTSPGGHRWVKNWWRVSDDEANTWSKPVLINPTGEPGRSYCGEPMRLTRSGRLLLPVRMCFNVGQHNKESMQLGEGWWRGKKIHLEGHNHYPEFDITYLYYSDDEGQTWCRCEGELVGWINRGWGNYVATDEPSVEQLKDGRLIMLMRSTIGRLMQSFSQDQGEHWSVPEPAPLASAYAPCALKRIPKTGDLLCVWNQTSPDEIRLGHQRGRLSAAITADGHAWQHFRTIERQERLSDADRIEPEAPLMCRCLDDVGMIPEGRMLASYPTIAFNNDEVILTYPVIGGAGTDLVSAMKIRVLPLSWFYCK